MKLTEEQLHDLNYVLKHATKYQETYDELYDHILTTLENRKEMANLCVVKAAMAVIDDEFGGYEALKNMETVRHNQISKSMNAKHWENIKWFFNWPAIAFTMAIAIAGYLIDTNAGTHRELILITMTGSLMPMLFLICRKIVAWYNDWKKGVSNKISIKAGYIGSSAILSCNGVNVANYLLKNFEVNGACTVIVFVCFFIYVLSLFKLYNEEYRIIFA